MKHIYKALLSMCVCCNFTACHPIYIEPIPKAIQEEDKRWSGISPHEKYKINSEKFSISRSGLALIYNESLRENRVVSEDRMILKGVKIQIKKLKLYQPYIGEYLGCEVHILSGKYEKKIVHARFSKLVDNIVIAK